MISLAGFKPNVDIKIEYVGLRPGEKLYEELMIDHLNETHDKTSNDKIYIEKQKHVEESLLDLEHIRLSFEDLSNYEVKKMVSKIITTYKVNGK